MTPDRPQVCRCPAVELGRLFNLPIAAGTGAAAATRRHRRKPFRRFDVTVGAPTSARPGIA